MIPIREGLTLHLSYEISILSEKINKRFWTNWNIFQGCPCYTLASHWRSFCVLFSLFMLVSQLTNPAYSIGGVMWFVLCFVVSFSYTLHFFRWIWDTIYCPFILPWRFTLIYLKNMPARLLVCFFFPASVLIFSFLLKISLAAYRTLKQYCFSSSTLKMFSHVFWLPWFLMRS